MTFPKKAAITAAVLATVGGVAFGASAFAAGGDPVTTSVRPATLTAPSTVASKVVAQTIGKGTVDGLGWSVVLEFYPTLPKGYAIPAKGMKMEAGKSSLLCQRMMIGGVRIDHQGGPWADCQPVAGAHDPSQAGGAGLWGLTDKGTRGSRLFVATVGSGVSSGVLDLADGSQLKASAVTVPGTSYRAFAVAIAKGKTITSVDTYDGRHHRLTHDTYWR
ncbi:hypothetical protein OHA18_25500 [Kribbella sp. NBC_00709]|uniref:hypothetical protein n=1 Tax=Kribbella sp. NBC_00709 TaxID=2975972 RepID=UPI002E27E8EC|nr:hypothetical protein [Kribbella sp. NBC_00709]